MKQLWIRLSTRVDALSLRERIMGFAAVLAVVVFAASALVLGPLFEKQEQLAALIERQQSAIVQVEQQMDQLAHAAQADPNAATRARLAEVQAEINRLGDELVAMQESLVPPERVTPLLQKMLRSNGRLRLVSLRTLPVTGLSESLPRGASQAASSAIAGAPDALAATLATATPATPATNAAAAARAPELVYRHGVEMTLEGRYLDMVSYMAALEAMPVRLIWGQAKLDARDYPQTRLTLTLFTLSLEKDWMKL